MFTILTRGWSKTTFVRGLLFTITSSDCRSVCSRNDLTVSGRVSSRKVNIVIAEIVPPRTVEQVLDALEREGVLAGGMGPGRVRFVTHLDVDDDGIERTLSALRAL